MPLAVPPTLSVLVGEADTVAEMLTVVDALSDPEGVPVAVQDAVPLLEIVVDPVGVTDGALVGETDAV